MKLHIALFSFLLVFVYSSASIQAQDTSYDDYNDLEYRKWRITLFPPLSTNGVAAPNYTAKYSINILAGYHGGLNGIEIGTLFNYNREYASGFQIAGLVNATGGYLEGINIAGLANYSSEDMSGIQIGGLGNFSKSDIAGLQAAGALNYARGDLSGLQGAIGGNVARGSVEGAQVSGIFNLAE